MSAMLTTLLARIPERITDVIGLSLRVTRAAIPPVGLQELERRGRCASCGRVTRFLRCSDRKVASLIRTWPYTGSVVRALRSRENYFCLWCGRNYRMRALASIAEARLDHARVYEPATFGVFTRDARRRASTYEVSEYLPGGSHGERRRRTRHEDIQALTFADESFDLVLTSELFEHVIDPWAGFREVRRVLRTAGRHIFTVPDVTGSPTRSRSSSAPVYHIDPLRAEGALVITDFGDDLPDLLQPLGFETIVHHLPSAAPILRIFESVAR